MAATTFSNNLTGTASNPVTITLNSLASSLTAGRQSTAVTLIDGNNNVPAAIAITVAVGWAAGSPANDQAFYLWMARSWDGTIYEGGVPAVGASDAAYSFANSPVGTSPKPTTLFPVGALPVNATGEAPVKTFVIYNPPAKFCLIGLNYGGNALASSGNAITYRAIYGDGR